MRGTITRARRRVNPRRFPGLLRAHALLIVMALVAASAVVVLRSSDGGASPAAVAQRGAAAAALPAGAIGSRPRSAPSPEPASIDARLAAGGYEMPPHALVYGAVIERGPDGLSYRQVQAGGGALGEGFWPASSIKVLAALGALDFARTLGFTGDALVVFDIGEKARTLRSIYEAAIRDSSNYDYDLLVQIAGRDRLNNQFLTAANGFPATSITRPYDNDDLETSPPMIFDQGDRRTYVPERPAKLDPECDAGNCSNLFEMTESVRRIVLNDELPAYERFALDPSDIAALRQALLDADGFFPAPVAAVVGPDARIYDKPGDADGLDCLDVSLIEAPDGRRWLLSASMPHAEGGCDALADLATAVLRILVA
ncbi:MAG: hypothetical protein M3066_07350 [Actinomycetota bacterium]|nr:hypothetical protein [Actinomycetota bacterium]